MLVKQTRCAITTDNEIIKALECLFGGGDSCTECVYHKRYRFGECRKQVAKDALDLINRLQAKIEELVGNNDKLNIELRSMRSAANSLKMHYEEAQAEIERLKKTEIEIDDFCRRLCRMRMLNGSTIASYQDLQNYIQEEKSEAYKEFAERLKEDIFNTEYHIDRYYRRSIDNLVKEMVGDDNT